MARDKPTNSWWHWDLIGMTLDNNYRTKSITKSYNLMWKHKLMKYSWSYHYHHAHRVSTLATNTGELELEPHSYDSCWIRFDSIENDFSNRQMYKKKNNTTVIMQISHLRPSNCMFVCVYWAVPTEYMADIQPWMGRVHHSWQHISSSSAIARPYITSTPRRQESFGQMEVIRY